MIRKTKILATVGPSSDSIEVLCGLIEAGVNVFRMNFSHSDHKYHENVYNNIKKAMNKTNKIVGILQDICGPKIRVEKLKEDFALKANDTLIFSRKSLEGEKLKEGLYIVSINRSDILNLVKQGEHIYLYDGRIKTKILEIKDEEIITEVLNDGLLSSNKGVNFPNTKLNIGILTQKDKDDILWASKRDIDFIAISFVQNAKDILETKEILKQYNCFAKVFAKIEKFDAIENIDSIIKLSDGIMVARGDLGIEVPYYKVPTLQKTLIRKANEASIPVITATQMLLSMATNATATRAEISDVANAVLDGTDAVMLSEESAIGKDPINVVKTMSATILEAEKIFSFYKFNKYDFLDDTDIIASSTASLAKRLDVKAIVSFTSSGKSAQKMARYRPSTHIYAVSHDIKISRSLSISWGIEPLMVIPTNNLDLMISDFVKEALSVGILDLDSKYVLTAGYPSGVSGSTNFVRILKREEMQYYLNFKN